MDQSVVQQQFCQTIVTDYKALKTSPVADGLAVRQLQFNICLVTVSGVLEILLGIDSVPQSSVSSFRQSYCKNVDLDSYFSLLIICFNHKFDYYSTTLDLTHNYRSRLVSLSAVCITQPTL